jgi:hypothetical protein
MGWVVESVKLEIGNTSCDSGGRPAVAQVNTTEGQIGNIVNCRQMAELPLINRI